MVSSLFSAAVEDADSTAAAFFSCPCFAFNSKGDATAATIFPPHFFALDLNRDPTIFCDKGATAKAAACCLVCTAWFCVCMAPALNQGDTAE